MSVRKPDFKVFIGTGDKIIAFGLWIEQGYAGLSITKGTGNNWKKLLTIGIFSQTNPRKRGDIKWGEGIPENLLKEFYEILKLIAQEDWRRMQRGELSRD